MVWFNATAMDGTINYVSGVLFLKHRNLPRLETQLLVSISVHLYYCMPWTSMHSTTVGSPCCMIQQVHTRENRL